MSNKEMNNIDIVGTMNELDLKIMPNLGQFFTRREVIKDMIKLY